MSRPSECKQCKSSKVVVLQDANQHALMWPKTLRSFGTTVYVCVDCGYTESWIREKDMEKLQALWQKKLGPKGPIIR
ncbi:MAG: hypothetical protein NWR72_07035 [Bacteroidia bacterium]|nr:hypothetical protein [Bacteroidia bacterium]